KALSADLPLSIDRDPAYWEFILYKRRQFWSSAPAGTGTPISLIALRGEAVVASGFGVVSGGQLRLQEAGALPGEEAALGAILDRIWSTALRAGAKSWAGWLPPGAERQDPRLDGEKRAIERSIPMAAPLGSTRALERLATDPASHFFTLDHI